jgi:hypothetical protein
MGYLLPVHYTQYQEYQNRMKRVKTNDIRPSRVERVKRIYLSQFQNNNLAQHDTRNNKDLGKRTEQVNADLTTGTGGNIDERI